MLTGWRLSRESFSSTPYFAQPGRPFVYEYVRSMYNLFFPRCWTKLSSMNIIVKLLNLTHTTQLEYLG